LVVLMALLFSEMRGGVKRGLASLLRKCKGGE
jgi:hypothetical protein